MANTKKSFQGDDLIVSLENVFKGVPNLPANIREVLVKIAPWLALIFGILGIIGGLGAIGVSPIGVLGGVSNGAFLLVIGVLTIVSSVMMVMAFPKLNKGEMGGWKLLFWSEVISFVSSLLALNVGSIISALIGAAIGFYLLFQIKSYYK